MKRKSLVHRPGIVRHDRNIPKRDTFDTFGPWTCPKCIAASEAFGTAPQ